MKTSFALLCLLASGCSLITVPVKTAGSIITTTVKTTGDIVTAPFDAVGRSKASDEPATGKKGKEEVKRAQSPYLEQESVEQ